MSASPESDALVPAEAQADLVPREFLVLGKLFEGRKPADIARDLNVNLTTIRHITQKPAMRKWIAHCQDAIIDRIARGEFGAMAVAKKEATEAMRRIVVLSRDAKDERVRLNANVKLLEFAGVVASRPIDAPTIDRVLDQLTPAEQLMFSETGKFPGRLADQLLRISAATLRQKDPANAEPTVEATVDDDAPLTPAEIADVQDLA